MVGEYGLAIDGLISAEVVTAKGELLTANSTANSDLFWAVRGGGNFGVVTNFEFSAHPVGDVYFGPITFVANNIEEILKSWRDYMRIAPEKLTTMVVLLPANAMGGKNPPMCILLCCWNRTDPVAHKRLATIKAKYDPRNVFNQNLNIEPNIPS